MAKAKKVIEPEMNTENITVVDFDGKEIKVKYAISINDMIGVVRDVFKMSFSDSGEYMPELTQALIRYYVIQKFTDYELPKSITEAYDIIMTTDLYLRILGGVNSEQLYEIEAAIHERINKSMVVSADVAEKNLIEVGERFKSLEEKMSQMVSELIASEAAKNESTAKKPARRKATK